MTSAARDATLRGSRFALIVTLVACIPLVVGLRAPFDPDEAQVGRIARFDVALDLDDDNENGVVDRDDAAPPIEDLVDIGRVDGPGRLTLHVEGGVRVFVDGAPRVHGERIVLGRQSASFAVQGVGETEGVVRVALDARVVSSARIVTHRIVFEGPSGPLSPTSEALSVSHGLPNDAAFVEGDPRAEDAFRVRVTSPEARTSVALRRIVAGDLTRRSTTTLRAPLVGETTRLTEPLRVVTSERDRDAPLVNARLLLGALRDRVDAEFETATGVVSQSIRIGRPPREDGPLAARVVSLDVHVVDDPRTSLVRTRRDLVETLTRRQITIANEVFAPCAVGFVVSPRGIAFERAPVGTMLTVGGDDGLVASGGHIVLALDGRRLAPVATAAGQRPTEVASRLAQALIDVGARVAVYVSPRGDRAHDGVSDIVVRNPDGRLATLAVVERTDARLAVDVTAVALDDGLLEFDNATARTGTREERALMLALSSGDPSSVDVFIVERFTRGSRVGESFLMRDGGPLAGMVALDFGALARTETAFTLSHELAHVLLDQPLHTTDLGRTDPHALLASGPARGDLRGARRLDAASCARMREVWAPHFVRREPFAAPRAQ